MAYSDGVLAAETAFSLIAWLMLSSAETARPHGNRSETFNILQSGGMS